MRSPFYRIRRQTKASIYSKFNKKQDIKINIFLGYFEDLYANFLGRIDLTTQGEVISIHDMHGLLNLIIRKIRGNIKVINLKKQVIPFGEMITRNIYWQNFPQTAFETVRKCIIIVVKFYIIRIGLNII